MECGSLLPLSYIAKSRKRWQATALQNSAVLLPLAPKLEHNGQENMAEAGFYYFDNNSTTRVAPQVVEAMLPFIEQNWGNPSSAYGFGRKVEQPLRAAREKVAALLNADPKEIIFTSGGTESDNTALQSALITNPAKRHIITSSVEHSAIMSQCRFLRRQGYEITFLPVNSDGKLDLQLLEKEIRPDTAVVSIMWANNETGVLFPIQEIAALCRSKGVLFHTDAVQTPGKIKIDVKALDIDMLSLSGHKFHAPKGTGVLYVKRRTRFQPYIMGGAQEQGRRAGTENVPGTVALGRAAELALDNLTEENTRVRALRDRLENGILERIPDVARVGAIEPRLPNTTNLMFGSVEAEAILMLMDRLGICASSGSACTTGSLEPSHVLTAMGLSPMQARSCVRFSLGIYNTPEEVDFLLNHLPPMISDLRKNSLSVF